MSLQGAKWVPFNAFNIMIIGIFLDNLTFNHEEDSQSKVWFPDILDILFDSFTQWTNWIGKWPCNWRFNLWNLFIEETLSWAAALYGVELSCRCELIKGAKIQDSCSRDDYTTPASLIPLHHTFKKVGLLLEDWISLFSSGSGACKADYWSSLISHTPWAEQPSSPVLKIESFRASKKSFPAARELGL